MQINEIFYSIQGEGTDMGLPTIFIRFTGCNLRCKYCDTKYAFYEGKKMSVKNIYEIISKWKCNRICITGGEPLLQDEVYDLIDFLLKKDYKVSVETNGSIDISNLAKKDVIIKMDIKLPSSGMHEKMKLENIYMLGDKDELKFVIGSKEDYKYAKKIIEEYKPRCNIIFQPVWKKLDAKNLAEWILEDMLNVRLSIQLHKILWGKERGK